MIALKNFVALLGVFVFFSNSYGFVLNKTQHDTTIKWPSHNGHLKLYITPDNNNGISRESVEDIITDVIARWQRQGGGIDIVPVLGHMSERDKTDIYRNDLYFSTDDIFGPSVLAITKSDYFARSGEIIGADIIINDNARFSINASHSNNSNMQQKVFYLGDVISHEIGHFFGLGHGHVQESTMAISLFKGKFSPHLDDLSGINFLYGTRPERGILKGKIPLENFSGTARPSIEAIAKSTGKTIISTPLGPKGEFSLNLPLHEAFFLRAFPLFGAKEAFVLPVQEFYLTKASEVARVEEAIESCSSETLEQANGDIVQIDGTVQNAATGYFLDSDIRANDNSLILNSPGQRKSHLYEIDLSGQDLQGQKELYLNIKLIPFNSHTFLRTNIQVSRGKDFGPTIQFPGEFNKMTKFLEPDHRGEMKHTGYILNHGLSISLDRGNPSRNVFRIEIIPSPLERKGPDGLDPKDFFPLSFNRPYAHDYMMTFTVSEQFTITGKDHLPPFAPSDSPLCLGENGVLSKSEKVL